MIGPRDNLDTFLQFVSSFLPSLKFSWSISDTSVNFLDLTISVDAGNLSTYIYYKETDSHSYLFCFSSHLSTCKDSIPYAQFKRLRRICSNGDDFNAKADKIRPFFNNWLYPNRTINQARRRVSTIDITEALRPSSQSGNNEDRIPLVISNHPSNVPIRKSLLRTLNCFANMNLLNTSSPILPSLHIVVSATLEIALFVPVWHVCKRSGCKTCAHILHNSVIR